MSIELYFSERDDKHSAASRSAVMVCTSTDTAFGPILYETDDNWIERWLEETGDHILRGTQAESSWEKWREAERCPCCGEEMYEEYCPECDEDVVDNLKREDAIDEAAQQAISERGDA